MDPFFRGHSFISGGRPPKTGVAFENHCSLDRWGLLLSPVPRWSGEICFSWIIWSCRKKLKFTQPLSFKRFEGFSFSKGCFLGDRYLGLGVRSVCPVGDFFFFWGGFLKLRHPQFSWLHLIYSSDKTPGGWLRNRRKDHDESTDSRLTVKGLWTMTTSVKPVIEVIEVGMTCSALHFPKAQRDVLMQRAHCLHTAKHSHAPVRSSEFSPTNLEGESHGWQSKNTDGSNFLIDQRTIWFSDYLTNRLTD